MSAPGEVRLKRKRTEDPLQSLLLTREPHAGRESSKKRVRYILKDEVLEQSERTVQDTSANGRIIAQQDEAMAASAKRTFHLKRPRASDDDSYSSKRVKNDRNLVPTFEETFSRLPASRRPAVLEDDSHSTSTSSQPSRTRRPGKGSAVRGQPTISQSNHGMTTDMQALADSMHQFALDELAKIPKPSTTAKPRMSPKESKVRHDRNVASTTSEPVSDRMDIDESDFVYDVYILTDSKIDGDHEGDVGLLVIRDDDEEYWQSLLEDDEQEDEVDEDDENAEDYYAADYPEDELASDDEYDNNAYNFRHRANSDTEQWDHRHGNEEHAEVDPFSMQSSVVKHWEQELGFKP